jgi:hypothetical protein
VSEKETGRFETLLIVLKKWFVFLLAAVIAFLGFQHAFGGVWLALLPSSEPLHRLVADTTVLYYFGTAALLLALERVTKFTLNKDGISAELAELRAEVKGVQDTQTETLLVAEGGIGKGSPKLSAGMEAFSTLEGTTEPPVDPDDPLKGRFGGKSADNGRRLSATVTPSKMRSGYFKVNLLVESLPGEPTLEGSVKFYLHPTFSPPQRTVTAVNGKARLELLSYGAFTVLAEADGGSSRLELDLAQDLLFPAEFREN